MVIDASNQIRDSNHVWAGSINLGTISLPVFTYDYSQWLVQPLATITVFSQQGRLSMPPMPGEYNVLMGASENYFLQPVVTGKKFALYMASLTIPCLFQNEIKGFGQSHLLLIWSGTDPLLYFKEKKMQAKVWECCHV